MDIWMLWCTYLELITWFLCGSKAVTVDFRHFRSERGEYGIYSDTFFGMDSDGNWSSAQLKPSVIYHIGILFSTPQCSPYLREFPFLIKTQILCIEPGNRITASDLRIKLQKLGLQLIQYEGKGTGQIPQTPKSQNGGKIMERILRRPKRLVFQVRDCFAGGFRGRIESTRKKTNRCIQER
ncbi:hypothetical protein RRF57_011594 [Xylaria bambusicola]|uniref:Uncharacterized protein n=1 Tax=Xylaria bambusicola TaxID=326684 RepID=A0AAN7ZA32_9PEZI